MYSAYKLNKQGDNIQPWRTPFPIWNQSVVPCPVLTVASWPAFRPALVVAQWICSLSCSMWDLVPQPGIKPVSSVSAVRSLSHWTTRKVPLMSYLFYFSQWNGIRRLEGMVTEGRGTVILWESYMRQEVGFDFRDTWCDKYCYFYLTTKDTSWMTGPHGQKGCLILGLSVFICSEIPSLFSDDTSRNCSWIECLSRFDVFLSL